MNRYLKFSLIFIGILVIGFTVYFYSIKSHNHSDNSHQKEVYSCPMHPEIIRDKPGNCPLCGMTLVKRETENNSELSSRDYVYTCPMPEDSVFSNKPGDCPKCGMELIKITKENNTSEDNSLENLLKPTDNFIVGNFETTKARDTVLSGEINLPGIVTYDPNSSVNISARMSGRIEKMYVNYAYQKVIKGQKLFDLYSPELLTEQQNFIYLITNDAENLPIIKASKQKLVLYGMTESQIILLSNSKKANPQISVYSPASGIIEGTEKMENVGNNTMLNSGSKSEILRVKQGDYIKKGEIVFRLLSTDKVWGIFNIIQGYNNLIKINQSIAITTEYDENVNFNTQINFIETQFNQTDKSNRIRVYLNNTKLKLPIGARLQGRIKTNPVKAIWIHRQAMVNIGTKNLVFVKIDNGFKAHEIITGIGFGDFVQIIAGISVDDSIAKNAHYLTDSESFIKTK